ncbi:MAG: glyoxalase [Candidatus Manganitrophaceae bacterium]|nr:MAG: glyoxalase [Candidatus Manganitrophaceae bacterium]
MDQVIFHLAFPVRDLEEAKRFYVEGLGCAVGRESSRAITLALAGHQLVGHLFPTIGEQKGIYPRHFGLIFKTEAGWQALVDRAKEKGLCFYQAPRRRFEGTRLEHATVFLEDPSHNLLEFKWYRYESAIFGEREFGAVGDTDDAP